MSLLSYLLMSIYRNREKIFLIENDLQYSYQQLLSAILFRTKEIRANREDKSKVYLREGMAFSTLVTFFSLLNNGINVALVNKNWHGEVDDEASWSKEENWENKVSGIELQKMLTEEMLYREKDNATLSFFSSGTTSDNPTEMIVTQENLFFSILSVSSTLRYDNQTRVGVTTPLSFDYSFYQFLMAISCGSSVVFSDFRVKAHHAFNAFSQNKCNFLALIPGLLKQFVNYYNFQTKYNLPDFITLTGEFLAQEILQQCHQVFPEVHIITMYGTTECKRISIAPPELCVIESNCVGIAIPGTRIKVKGEDGSLYQQGRGECVTEGPHVTQGYATEGPCQFIISDKERALYTKDRIHIDDEGFVTFLERADNLIKINGKRVDLKTVENFFNENYSAAYKITFRDNIVIISSSTDLPPEYLIYEMKKYFHENHGIRIKDVILQKKESLNLKGL